MIDPRKGGLSAYRMRKCENRNAFTYSHISAKVPPVGVEPETSTHAAQNIKQLTKYASFILKISESYRSRRFRRTRRPPRYSATSVRIGEDSHRPLRKWAQSVEIPADLTDLAHFWRDRREFHRVSPISPISRDVGESRWESARILADLIDFGEIGEAGEKAIRYRPFSARSARILTDCHRPPIFGDVGEVGGDVRRSSSLLAVTRHPLPRSQAPSRPLAPGGISSRFF